MVKRTVTFVFALMLAFDMFACAALTKKGKQCMRNPVSGSVYCWQHGGRKVVKDSAVKIVTNVASAVSTKVDFAKKTANSAVKEVKKKIDDNSARTQCTAIIKSGKQCTRKALPGGTKCWQHQ